MEKWWQTTNNFAGQLCSSAQQGTASAFSMGLWLVDGTLPSFAFGRNSHVSKTSLGTKEEYLSMQEGASY